MYFNYIVSEHANNTHAFVQDVHTPETRTLLGLPTELRTNIWAYSLQFEDDVEIAITAQRMISCKGGLRNPGMGAPRALAPQLLQTNKQIREEGRAVMYNSNSFSIVLNQASYLGYSIRIPHSISLAGGDLASIPSKWTSDIRHCVHQMRQLTLCVTLNPECERVHTPSRMLLEDKKSEIAAIVGTALGELCEILSFSDNLTSLNVNFLDLGREQLTTGNEHKVLGCLGQLKELKHVDICGLPSGTKGAKDYLENVMKLSKRSEEKRKDFPLSRAGKSWGSPYKNSC